MDPRTLRIGRGLGPMLAPLVLALVLLANLLFMTVPTSGQVWAHYVGALYHQGDGSRYQWLNCTLANLTVAMDCASGGYWRVPASRLRVLSADTSGGLTYDQIVALAPKATANEFHVTRLYFMPIGNLVDLLKAPRTVHISILCSVTIDTPFHTGTCVGRHNIGLYDYRVYSWTANGVHHTQEQVLVGDPGTRLDYRWWPLSLVLKAAQASDRPGACHVWYGPDLEGVTRTARLAIPLYATPSLTAAHVGGLTPGNAEQVLSTQAGPTWTYGGHTGNGWARITNAAGATGYVPGYALKAA